jgi:GNAT superfamily N-acetyltransferase
MAYRRGGSRLPDAPVEEVAAEELRPLREEIAAGEPWATDEVVVRMVLGSGELIARAGNGRHFAARVGNETASAADLYSDGRTAQVEDVATRPAFRGRGLASAVVLHAVAEASATGHDLIFLTTDDSDWPKELYARLGFAAIGRKWAFLRLPVPAGPTGTPPEAPTA